ncbi:hypothetical protein M8818_006735 [Zalaria obscura]|uniref:Uncharacterized protein n=1 Tax=Zalaria obscura TaxID=2024903 RepID=A0ACC3S507_9PEZI
MHVSDLEALGYQVYTKGTVAQEHQDRYEAARAHGAHHRHVQSSTSWDDPDVLEERFLRYCEQPVAATTDTGGQVVE